MKDKIYRIFGGKRKDVEVYGYKNGCVSEKELIDFKKSMKENGFKFLTSISEHNARYIRLVFNEKKS